MRAIASSLPPFDHQECRQSVCTAAPAHGDAITQRLQYSLHGTLPPFLLLLVET